MFLLADGVSSQKKSDREIAFKRLEQSGIFFTSAESAIFELLGDAKNPKFKLMLPILKMNVDQTLFE